MPGVRVLGTPIACESTVAADIEAGIKGAFNDIVAALTRPLSEEEKNPQPKTDPSPRIAFKGNSQEVHQFFYRKGWGDGLPIVPPSEAAVAEMLAGTNLPANHMVAKLIPRMGKATVEKIAVNAVMAGALPVHMPVLIAAVQALSDPKTRFDTFEVSTGSWAPFLLLNGPIRNEININCSSGALSPGNIANSAIGRAVGLIVKNIGGARKAIEDMGTLGNPGKFALVLGEFEEESPWPPLHVDRGFKKTDNVLTVFFPNGYRQSIPSQTNAEGIAASLSAMGPRSLSALIVIPDHARIFSSEGWTKQRVREYIIQSAASSAAASAKRPASAKPAASGAATGANPVTPGAPAAKSARRGGPLADEDFIVVVAGGPGVWHGLHQSAGGFENSFVSKKIELPSNWDKLVAKYKNLVPNYVTY